MKATLEVLYEDGTTVEAQFSTVDLVKFESAHNRSATTIFDERRVGDLTWLAWHALRRTGAIDKKTGWATFDDACIEAVDTQPESEAADLPDPTKPDTSGETSSS